MTEKLKCPFCGAELQHWGEDFLYCENLGCPMSPQIELPISIWQVLIDSKKAQRQLRTVKDHCVKKVKAKEREIENYLNGMFVREQEIGTLREQLKQAHDALNVARNLYQELAQAYCEMVDDYRTTYGCLKTPEQETQEYMQEYDEKISSITKQEFNNEK